MLASITNALSCRRTLTRPIIPPSHATPPSSTSLVAQSALNSTINSTNTSIVGASMAVRASSLPTAVSQVVAAEETKRALVPSSNPSTLINESKATVNIVPMMSSEEIKNANAVAQELTYFRIVDPLIYSQAFSRRFPGLSYDFTPIGDGLRVMKSVIERRAMDPNVIPSYSERHSLTIFKKIHQRYTDWLPEMNKIYHDLYELGTVEIGDEALCVGPDSFKAVYVHFLGNKKSISIIMDIFERMFPELPNT